MAEVLGTDPGTGRSGKGTKLSGSSCGAIGMIRKLTVEGADVTEIDLTTMNSPGNYEVIAASIISAKAANIDLVYEGINTGILLAKLGVSQVWTITLPGGSTWVQTGFLKKGPGPDSPYNDKITSNIIIRFSGPPVFNIGSGD